jgi:dTDP-4-amino-4,6-dideoxygalactose transaminase
VNEVSAANILSLQNALTLARTPAMAEAPLVNSATVTTLPSLDSEPLYFARPSAQYRAMHGEIDAAIQSVLDGHTYILGEAVKQFEAEFAAYTGAKFAIGVANGTDALHLALRALGIGEGDEVITTAHTAIATVAAIEMSGATPVFADITADRYTLDPVDVVRKITPRTKAILPVHLYGHPADLGPLLELAARHKLEIIEDCAQAHAAEWQGRQVGTIGKIGCFSLYPTKNLGAIGDAGIVITSDEAVADRLRLLRQYGWKDKQLSLISGFNSRLDELQAAILRVKLRHLDETTARRRAIAKAYSEAFADLPLTLPRDIDGCLNVYHLFVLRTPKREELKAHLAKQNIHAGIHYPVPCHRHPALAERCADLRLPVTEQLAEQILSLPMYPELTDGQVERVIRAVRSFYTGA